MQQKSIRPEDYSAIASPIDTCEQVEPDDIHEVEVPSARLEPDVVARAQLASGKPTERHSQEGSADQDVEPVEACGQEERRA